MKRLILILVAVPVFACQPVAGDRIVGKDLAAANPIFAGLEPNVELGFTPLAGVQRTMPSAELLRIAREHNISIAGLIAPVCFVRVTEHLTAEQLQPALVAAFQKTGAEDEKPQFEIVDFSRYGVPDGTLEFNRSNLGSSGLWRGRVIYGEARSAPIWVKIRFAPGSPETNSPHAPSAVPAAAPSASGPLVDRGDTVQVEVTSGEALLKFESKAESRGRVGEWILLRNPINDHLFRAKVEAKGRVSIQK